MQEDEVRLQPNIIAGSLSRILENFKHQDEEVNPLDPDRTDNEGDRALPHMGLGLTLSFLIVGIPSGLLFFEFIEPEILGRYARQTGVILFFLGLPVVSFIIQVFFLFKELKHQEYVIRPNGVDIIDDYWDRGVTSTSFENITDARLEKPLIQRIFSTGNVILNTSGSSKDEIRIEYIKNPEIVQEEISDIISNTEYRQYH
jgi:hypothetical protein